MGYLAYNSEHKASYVSKQNAEAVRLCSIYKEESGLNPVFQGQRVISFQNLCQVSQLSYTRKNTPVTSLCGVEQKTNLADETGYPTMILTS